MKKNKNIKLYILIIIAILSVTIMTITLATNNRQTEFVPPKFDELKIPGVPSVSSELGYNEIYRDGMAYRFSICGKIIVDSKNQATVYLTNHVDNDVWLKVRIYNENGKVLGESGLIKPNEYIEKVALNSTPKNGSKITMKIMGYVPDSYQSAGAVSLNTYIYYS